MTADDLRQRVLAFMRKVAPFAYCDACLALRLEVSLAEVTAALAGLPPTRPSSARAGRATAAGGRWS
jgi:hypothetical protein